MKKALFVFLIAAISCSDNKDQQNAITEIPVVHRDMSSEVYKTVAIISIEGMMCETGCGGKIQNELRALNGVKMTELEFVENRQANIVRVEYDPTATDEKKLFERVQSIADGKYKVTSAEIIHYKGLQSSQHGGALPV